MAYDLRAIGTMFSLVGDYVCARPYGSGHINDTFMAEYNQGGAPVRYIHQRVNHLVFRNPVRLMENITRVTAHQRKHLASKGAIDASRRSLTLVPTDNGKSYVHDEVGNIWRTYVFIEGARTYDIIHSTRQALEAAKAFGAFQRMLIDLPGEPLHQTIPFFHHTRKRYEKFIQVLKADPCNRASLCRPEQDFIMAREEATNLLLDLQRQGELPERITHNDTKLNNVMLDDATQEGICIIDLDTVMPGLSLYDFGDLVRTSTATAVEDETDLSKVKFRLDMFEALVAGYMETAGCFLNRLEKEHLAFAGKLLALENGIRFLSDFLEGDQYFKTSRENHNLDRCRTQLALVAAIEVATTEMREIVEKYQ